MTELSAILVSSALIRVVLGLSIRLWKRVDLRSLSCACGAVNMTPFELLRMRMHLVALCTNALI